MVAEQSHAQESPQRAARQHRRGGTTQHTTRTAPHQENAENESVYLENDRQVSEGATTFPRFSTPDEIMETPGLGDDMFTPFKPCRNSDSPDHRFHG